MFIGQEIQELRTALVFFQRDNERKTCSEELSLHRLRALRPQIRPVSAELLGPLAEIHLSNTQQRPPPYPGNDGNGNHAQPKSLEGTQSWFLPPAFLPQDRLSIPLSAPVPKSTWLPP
ncbi:hypothetical protein ABVK25_003558 [Lepraria finkii]|uniref:Uncharacterized protein n=1 Tax=Lepraria finkii TaxID=1340010 RepID=A0ABR4BDJ7_9LECA